MARPTPLRWDARRIELIDTVNRLKTRLAGFPEEIRLFRNCVIQFHSGGLNRNTVSLLDEWNSIGRICSRVRLFALGIELSVCFKEIGENLVRCKGGESFLEILFSDGLAYITGGRSEDLKILWEFKWLFRVWMVD